MPSPFASSNGPLRCVVSAAGQVIDLLEHVLTPTIRVGVFREMKRAALDHMREAPDKYPNRLTWQEFVAFMAGCR